jgi:hypothetical protein
VARSYTLDEKTLQRLRVVWADAATAKFNGCQKNPVEVSAAEKAIMREHNAAVERAVNHANKIRRKDD